MTAYESERLAARRAIESLRAGVPNPEVVRALSSGQEHITNSFAELLDRVRTLDNSGPSSLIIAGGFGTGKSHNLEALRQLALRQDFAVSMIAISKETPLGNPARVATAAIQDLRTRQFEDDLLKEVVTTIRTDTQAFAALIRWAKDDPELSPIFHASLMIRAKADRMDLDALDPVLSIWSNDKVNGSDIARAARKVGAFLPYMKMPPQAARAWQTVRFLPKLLQAAGSRGWIVLLDEAELIGRYGPVSRALAYDQLARWLGLRPEHRIPGLGTVAAITDDFTDAVLFDKLDLTEVPRILGTSDKEVRRAMVPFAEDAMAAIRYDTLALNPADEPRILDTAQLLRDLYELAYLSPTAPGDQQVVLGRPMRSYIRRWINRWDLERLYPAVEVTLEEEVIDFSYEEDRDSA